VIPMVDSGRCGDGEDLTRSTVALASSLAQAMLLAPP
jgi:hypothetical protein